MMQVYKSQIVQDIESFYGELLHGYKADISIHSYLKNLSKRLWQGIKEKNLAVETEINTYHPNYLGLNGDVFIKNNLKRKDARLTVAREYGFNKWKDLKRLRNKKFDLAFEEAVEYLLNGDQEALEDILIQYPNLIHQRSKFGHQATLLHYTASNGVEMWRQRVPENLPEITQCLLD